MRNLKFVLIFSISVCFRAVLSTKTSPQYVVTKAAYAETISSLNAHVKYVESLPDLRPGSTPIFFIHRPSNRVYGSVILFHGFGYNAAGSMIQAKHLFSQKFNVIALNLAGFAQSPKHWVPTVLRESAGYSTIRAALLKDPVISSKITAINNARTSEEQAELAKSFKELTMPLVAKTLRKSLSRRKLEVAKRAISLLDVNVQKREVEKQFSKFFISGHQQFESDPFAKLRFVQALPGPIHAVSYSFGATALLNLAAQSRVISKTVMLAPFLSFHTASARVDLSQFYMLLGALDLLPDAGRSTTSTNIAAGLVNRERILRTVRKTSRTLCILAADDSVIDIQHTRRVCRGKLGGSIFVYPKYLNINHRITPEAGSKYGNAMLEQIANFFISGNVHEARFLTPNK